MKRSNTKMLRTSLAFLTVTLLTPLAAAQAEVAEEETSADGEDQDGGTDVAGAVDSAEAPSEADADADAGAEEAEEEAAEAADGEPESTENGSEPEVAEEAAEEPEAPVSDAADEVTDAELERFLSESQLGEDGSFNAELDIYGFADFNYTHFLSSNDDPWRILYNNKGHFGVGNLNVYFDGKISKTLRTLAEVRFTYLPHGHVDDLGPPTTRASNVSSDYTRNERDITLGGLRIERAWLQWSPHQSFRVKAGHWLTPYGIWNVDHGTPTIVSVTRPFMIDEELLPESQAGLLAEGRFDLTDHFALEYAAGVSNGRGPIFMYYDFDANKGVTGRLKLLYTGFGELQVGASAYRGKYTAADIGLDIGGELSSQDIITTQFTEVSYAADIRYKNGGFLFQSEAMLNDRVYSEDGRSETTGGLAPDTRRWGIYGLTGYRFDWLGIMPYGIAEYAPVPNATIPELPREVLLLGGGVNIRPMGQVVVKVGYDQAILPENRPNSFDEHTIRRLQAQVAWAF